MASAQGLVAAYSFDEGSGTTLGDSSGNSNTGTIANGSWTTSGKFGNAVTFNGSGTLVTVADANSLDLTSGMTLEAWVYPTSLEGWRTVLMKETSGTHVYLLYASDATPTYPAGYARFAGGELRALGAGNLPLNTWSHLAMTYDGSALRLYVNGTQVASEAITGSIQTSTGALRIGGNTVWGEYFAGRIDEVRIYNRALSAAEIATDISTPVGGGGGGDIQAPSTPTGLTATAASSTQINLSWTASTDNVGVTGYLVERCQGAGCSNFTQIATPTTTNYNDTGRTPSTSYSYRVRATDAANNLSLYSTSASATTPAAPDITAPTDPTGLSATATSSTQINLSWTASTDNVGVTGYLVERCQGASCSNFSQIATPTTTGYNDTGLTASTTYRYRVRARDAVPNYSNYSSTASATTQAPPDIEPPSTPTGLAASAVSSSQINLSWTASTDNVGVTGYLVERCQGAGCSNFSQIATPTTTTYNDTGRSASTSYSYRVRARDAANNLSSYSSTASATTQTAASGGLVGAYSFDEGNGTTLGDGSGNSNTGTIANGSWTTSGKFGNALTFNGTSSMVSVADANSLDLTTGMTLEAWVYPTTLGSEWRTVLMKETSGTHVYLLYASDANPTYPAGYARFAGGELRALGASTLPLNTWSHLATTYDGSALRLYVNGTQVASEAITGSIQTSTGALRIGGNSVWGEYFAGRIDEVRIYSRALSAAEIAADMSSPVGGGSGGDTQSPSAPTALGATATSSTQINLSWTASTDNVGVTGYLLERCQGAGCSNFTQIATPTTASYSDTGLTASTSYSYRVRARDAVPNYSTYSGTSSATTSAPPDIEAPTVPSNLGASATSSTQINLSWTASTDNVGVTEYLIERCQGAGCSTFAQIATPTSTSYSDTGLSASTSYSYRVRARDAVPNYSNYSGTATATTHPGPDTQPPSMPNGLTATAVSISQVNVSWSASSDNVGVTAYLLERCAGVSCTSFAQIASQQTTMYSDTGRTGATTYKYRVRAIDAASNPSDYSVPASATTSSPTITYSYDSLKRVIGATSSDGTSVTYEYDANGNVKKITRTGAP